jgi:hypothetical protein
MTSPDPTPIIATLGVEPTYSVREAVVLLGRSFSWLDQRVRKSEFARPDGTKVEPLRTPGGYRLFTLAMLVDIALSCHRHRWFSMEKLKFVTASCLSPPTAPPASRMPRECYAASPAAQA